LIRLKLVVKELPERFRDGNANNAGRILHRADYLEAIETGRAAPSYLGAIATGRDEPLLRLQKRRAVAYTSRPFRIRRRAASTMKADIHPKYGRLRASCSCGNVIETRSTHAGEMHLDVCSNCHPFYTGKQKILDTGGRVERFRRRFGTRTLAS
jgi:large subunit ribosomal protein L31